jgi:DNA-binding NarL/FixJ family response regulator
VYTPGSFEIKNTGWGGKVVTDVLVVASNDMVRSVVVTGFNHHPELAAQGVADARECRSVLETNDSPAIVVVVAILTRTDSIAFCEEINAQYAATAILINATRVSSDIPRDIDTRPAIDPITLPEQVSRNV